MFAPSEYELIDFGGHRKLERFGEHLLVRPAPAATNAVHEDAEIWAAATAEFSRGQPHAGHWRPPFAANAAWTVRCDRFVLELKPTDAGHLGLFPEHARAWTWIDHQIRAARRPLKVLNLFAYTGAASLAAAAAGAEVVHVDAARNVVRWARRNAELSGLNEAPIRWIAEDATRFVTRECRRGNQYDAVILDPPTYGHGPKGEAWKIRQLPELLEMCAQLTRERLAFVHLSCHSEGYGPAELQAHLLGAFFHGSCQAGGRAGTMTLSTQDGRALNCGAFARWPS